MAQPVESTGQPRASDAAAARARELIRDVADFPKPGVLFKDITPLLADGAAFTATVDAMLERVADAGPFDKVLGIEARGFILAAPVAIRAGVGFVPVRKFGKLPGQTRQVSYDLEYGAAVLEITADALEPGERVLLVDDVLATGGTLEATISLLGQLGVDVAAVSVLIELGFLDGRARLGGRRVEALLTV